MKSTRKGSSSEVFSSKSSRNPKTCFALHIHVHCGPSQNGDTLSQTHVAHVVPQAWLPHPEHGEKYFVRQREKGEGPHAYTHHLHFIQEADAVKGWFWEDNQLPTSKADTLIHFGHIIGRASHASRSPVPGPCHPQVCPSQLPSLGSARGCR